MNYISIYMLHILDWSEKSKKDPQKCFRIIARGDSLILQSISVIPSKSVTGS